MKEIVDALASQHGELRELLEGAGEPAWSAPSRCGGWTVGDVVLHLAQTDEMALASVRGSFETAVEEFTRGMGAADSVDDGAEKMVARQRGLSGTAIFSRWVSGSAALREALECCDPHRRLRWIAGDLSARTLATTRLAEAWIHTGDVALGVGRTIAPSDRLWHIARLAWRTIPYAFAQSGRELHGPVAMELKAPTGATWRFDPPEEPLSVIRGDAADLCLVAGRRCTPDATTLSGTGPDAGAVLELIRTYA